MQTTRSQDRIVTHLPRGTRLFHHGGISMTESMKLHFPITAQHNVRTPTGHVGGNGDRATAPGIGNDLCLALMLFGVQHIVLDPRLLEALREQFRNINRRRTH